MHHGVAMSEACLRGVGGILAGVGGVEGFGTSVGGVFILDVLVRGRDVALGVDAQRNEQLMKVTTVGERLKHHQVFSLGVDSVGGGLGEGADEGHERLEILEVVNGGVAVCEKLSLWPGVVDAGGGEVLKDVASLLRGLLPQGAHVLEDRRADPRDRA